MKFNDLDFYMASHLDKIKNEYIWREELASLYDFLSHEFFELFNVAKEAHRKFFWVLLYNEEDFNDLVSQANAWSIPVFSFENHKNAHKRIIREINFILLKGSKAQTNEILSVIFGDGKWRFNVYSSKNLISLDVIGLDEAKLSLASEYLDYSFPPYIQFQILEYAFPEFTKRYSFADILELGGRDFLLSSLKKYINDAFILPFDSFKINESSLGESFLKVTEKGEDLFAIVLLKTKTVSTEEINLIIRSFFLKDTEIFVFNF